MNDKIHCFLRISFTIGITLFFTINIASYLSLWFSLSAII